MVKKIDVPGTGIRIAAAVAMAAPLAFAGGLAISRRLDPSPQDLWSLLGSAVGAVAAIGGAASLYFFQQWHEGRRTVRVLHQLLGEYADRLIAASRLINAGNIDQGIGRVHGAVDAIEALNATVGRLSDPSVAVAHLQVTLGILKVDDLRNFAEQLRANPEGGTDLVDGLAAAARCLQDRLIEDSS
jgi:hypothetical protein